MDTRQQFLEVIQNEYSKIVGNNMPNDLLKVVSEAITDYYYDQYQRFSKQYPKSIKRYSSFQTKDLDHPNAFELIIKTLKKAVGPEYEIYAMLMLKMSKDELTDFERRMRDFHNMF
jgi:hypothetical protein